MYRPSHWIQRRFVAELIYLGLSIVRPKWAAPRVYVTVVGNWAFFTTSLLPQVTACLREGGSLRHHTDGIDTTGRFR